MHKRILLAILVGLLIPLPQTVVPAWTAQVVDESGAPQPGATVREVWRQYSLESASYHDQRNTDAKGMVSFPRRSLWRPAIVNLIGIVRNRMKDGNRALYGPVAYLVASRGNAQSFTDRCGNCKMVLHAMR
ncbi:MAG: hypothetical protein ACRD30_06650 [Bryobacteraceae bacterium]